MRMEWSLVRPWAPPFLEILLHGFEPHPSASPKARHVEAAMNEINTSIRRSSAWSPLANPKAYQKTLLFPPTRPPARSIFENIGPVIPQSFFLPTPTLYEGQGRPL